MKQIIGKRLLSIFLCLCMAISLLPMSALADEGQGEADSLTPTLMLKNTDSIFFGSQGYCYLEVDLTGAKACHRYSVEINGVDNNLGVIAKPQYYVSDHNGEADMHIRVNRTDEMKNGMSAKITVKDLEENTVACEKQTIISANDDVPYFSDCKNIEMQGAEKVDFNELEIHNMGKNTNCSMILLEMQHQEVLWQSVITSDDNGICKPSIPISASIIDEDNTYRFAFSVDGNFYTSDDIRIFLDKAPEMNFDKSNDSSSEVEVNIGENDIYLTTKIQNMIEPLAYNADLVQIGKNGTADTDNYIVKYSFIGNVFNSSMTINLSIPKADLSSKEQYKLVIYNPANKENDKIESNLSFTKEQLGEKDDTYAVTVYNGTGDGNYEKGATVTITADAASSGKHFKNWTVVSGGVTLASTTSTTTTFTMPAGAVEVKANYENDTAPAPNESVDTDIPSDVPVGKVSGIESAYNTIVTDNTKGYTAADKAIVDAGGSALIYLKAEAITGNSTGSALVKSKIASDGKKLGVFINLNIFKDITPLNERTSTTQLVELPEIIKVTIDIPKAEQGMSNYSIYRYHEGVVDVITTTPNADGEYIEVSADGKHIILHIKKFSEYAIAYSEKAVVPTEPNGNTTNPQTNDNNNMIFWVALLFISGGAVITSSVSIKRKKHQAR